VGGGGGGGGRRREVLGGRLVEGGVCEGPRAQFRGDQQVRPVTERKFLPVKRRPLEKVLVGKRSNFRGNINNR